MIKKYLSAANTPRGFVSFFENVVDEANMEKVIYIKGGSGTGKSSFMKKMGGEAQKRGYEVFGLPCSSDIDSLDMLIIDDIKTVLVDATAPHNIDPHFPVVIGETINLAAFLDESKLKPNKTEILDLCSEKALSYKLLYGYLAASEKLVDGVNDVAASAMNARHIENIANEIHADFLYNQQPLKDRRAFMDYLSVDGYVNLFDELTTEKNIAIKCKYDIGVWELFRCLFKKLELYVHKYYSPVKPDRLAHITCGNINVISNPQVMCDYEFNLNAAFDDKALKRNANELKYLKKNYDVLVKNAGVQLANAKNAHRALEEYYVAAMDFDGVNAEFERVKDKIFKG